MHGFNNITPAQLEQLGQSTPLQLVDVRTGAEVAQGMIDGALHIPLYLLPLQYAELDPARPAVFYCQSGMRSAQACAFLAARGYAALYNLQGGILAWLQQFGRAVCQPV